LNERSPSELIKQIEEDGYEKGAAARAAEEAVNDLWLDQSVSSHNVIKDGILSIPTTPVEKNIARRAVQKPWSCNVCTYVNSTGDICEICLWERRERYPDITSETHNFNVRKKAMATSMKRMWWKKQKNRRK